MRFLACVIYMLMIVTDDLVKTCLPKGNEVIIPFSSKHSAPLGDIWNIYSTYFRAVIAG